LALGSNDMLRLLLPLAALTLVFWISLFIVPKKTRQKHLPYLKHLAFSAGLALLALGIVSLVVYLGSLAHG
jgi:cytochrome c oxidase assembly factor CtaG